MQLERGNIKRYKKFKTCEGDNLFLVGKWRKLHEKIVDHTDPNFRFGDVFNDGDTEWQDNKRILRYFLWHHRIWPLTEFGIFGGDCDVQVISFIDLKEWKVFGKAKRRKEIHFINGYNMEPGMEWMLIEVGEKGVRIFECDPKCHW